MMRTLAAQMTTMSNQEKVFAEGIWFNERKQNQPDFVLGSLSITPGKFMDFLQSQTPDDKGYVKLQILMSRDGNRPYMCVDNWKPSNQGQNAPRTSAAPQKRKTPESSENVDWSTPERPQDETIEYPEEDINPDDIPF